MRYTSRHFDLPLLTFEANMNSANADLPSYHSGGLRQYLRRNEPLMKMRINVKSPPDITPLSLSARGFVFTRITSGWVIQKIKKMQCIMQDIEGKDICLAKNYRQEKKTKISALKLRCCR